MIKITSLTNEYVKEIAKLKEASFRNQKKQFLVEGYNLVNEAFKAGCLKTVIVTSLENLSEMIFSKHQDVVEVNSKIMEKLSSTHSAPKAIGVCNFFEVKPKDNNKILLLDNIQDPSNLGTIIRSALAFDFSQILIYGPSAVDKYNEKFMRSSQGGLFHISISNIKSFMDIMELKKNGYRIFGTDLSDTGTNLREVENIPEKFVLIVGNEGHGISNEIRSVIDTNVMIPIKNINSLNVAAATAIIMNWLTNHK